MLVWASALWFRTSMYRYVSTGPLAHLFAHFAYSFACFTLLTHSLASHCLLCSAVLIHSLAHSLPSSRESEWLYVSKRSGFVLQRSGPVIPVDYWRVLRGICSKAFSESISYLPLIRVLKLWSRTAKCPSTLWARIIKNPDVRTGLLGRSFACWLAPFTYYLAPHCSLNLRAMLSSLACSLAQPLNPELVGK